MSTVRSSEIPLQATVPVSMRFEQCRVDLSLRLRRQELFCTTHPTRIIKIHQSKSIEIGKQMTGYDSR